MAIVSFTVRGISYVQRLQGSQGVKERGKFYGIVIFRIYFLLPTLNLPASRPGFTLLLCNPQTPQMRRCSTLMTATCERQCKLSSSRQSNSALKVHNSSNNQIQTHLLRLLPEITNTVFEYFHSSASIHDRQDFDGSYPPFDWGLYPGGAPILLTCQ